MGFESFRLNVAARAAMLFALIGIATWSATFRPPSPSFLTCACTTAVKRSKSTAFSPAACFAAVIC